MMSLQGESSNLFSNEDFWPYLLEKIVQQAFFEGKTSTTQKTRLQ